MDMIEGDNIAGNYQTEIDLNNGGWILIAILIVLVILLFIIALYIHITSEKKIHKLEEFYKSDLSDKERNLLMQYRYLKDTDKNVIDDTLKSLSVNHTNNNIKDD